MADRRLFSDGHETAYSPYSRQIRCDEWNMGLAPLWFGFLWVCIAPFLSLYRVGPLSSFYLEADSLLGAVVLVLATSTSGLLNVRLPSAGIAFFVLAAFWWLQARMMHLMYPGLNDMAAWTFVILALTAWACRGWVAEYGQERVAAVFAWALLFGALMQAAVALMQFNGWAGMKIFHNILAYGGRESINGQLGQRNHLGHYLMWGVLAASYLWSVRRMPAWAGVLSITALSAALGLVNSRTILTYVIGVGLLLPVWRWRAGKESSRTVLIFLFTIALVAIIQFGMGPLLDTFGNGHYETAVERVGRSSFEGSARETEWGKAWIAFKTAPLFGHGWNGFALQSFLINAEQHNFINNVISVLFTHSHNIVLQLLAETGLVGTLLTAGCLIAAIWRMTVRPYHPASLLMLSLMAVSLCHSMLEYPLWYIYFLTPFGIMVSLSPIRRKDLSDGLNQAKLRNYAGGIAALCLIAGILHLGWVYTDLTEYSRRSKTDMPADTALKIEGLRRIADSQPMLRYYAQLSLTHYADPTDIVIRPWAEQAAIEALTFRPFANAHQVGLYRYRRGETEQGAQWMQSIYYYYPYMMPFYASKIRSNGLFKPLLPKILADCKAFVSAPKHETAKSCEAPK